MTDGHPARVLRVSPAPRQVRDAVGLAGVRQQPGGRLAGVEVYSFLERHAH